MGKAKTGEKARREVSPQKHRLCADCGGKLRIHLHLPLKRKVWHCENNDAHRFTPRGTRYCGVPDNGVL